MKNAVLLLLVYSAVVTVFLIAYFLPIRQALGRLFGGMNFAQRFILAFAFFTIVAVVGVFVLLLWLKIDVTTNLGQVGDFVGGILNPILSFLALIAIVSSMSLQEKELSSTVESLKSQEEIFKIQNFESSLFNLLAMFRQRRQELVYIGSDKKEIAASKQVAIEINKHCVRMAGERGVSDLSAHRNGRKFISEQMDSIVGSVIVDQIFMIRRFIDNALLSESQKKFYYTLAYKDFDLYERVLVCNLAIYYRWWREILKKNKLMDIRGDWLASPFLVSYFSK